MPNFMLLGYKPSELGGVKYAPPPPPAGPECISKPR